jgi:hypothetical protein
MARSSSTAGESVLFGDGGEARRVDSVFTVPLRSLRRQREPDLNP